LHYGAVYKYDYDYDYDDYDPSWKMATSKQPFKSCVQTTSRLQTTKPHWTHYGDDILLLLPTAEIGQTRLHILRCRRRNVMSLRLSFRFLLVLALEVLWAQAPDGLRPQHLLDLINCQEAGHALVMAITALINLFLHGWCPSEVTAVLFGGKLLALTKKSGGVRPIAISYTWRRLAAKCANYYVMSYLQDKLLPFQLGVNTPDGCEAVVRATRQLTSKMTVDDVGVKLDFSNAFNCVHRDVMSQTIADELPYHTAMEQSHVSVIIRFGL
jgi:hypothetical protein